MSKRTYRLGRRAQSLEATRRRITRATMELHIILGPSRTTIAAIARRAGVQRLTVYRHFPSLRLLLKGCAGLHHELHPQPEPGRWKSITDPESRLRRGLRELYAYYAETALMWANVLRDAETNRMVREAAARGGRFIEAAQGALAEGWRVAPGRRRLLKGALAHALAFRTWETLIRRQKLQPREAISLMVSLVRVAASEGANR